MAINILYCLYDVEYLRTDFDSCKQTGQNLSLDDSFYFLASAFLLLIIEYGLVTKKIKTEFDETTLTQFSQEL